jgi:DNA-binding NarL/FixJ family response regulator
VVLADDPRGTWAAEALRAGARAVLPREATADEIIGAVEAAAAGLVVLHPAVTATLLPLLPTPARAVSAPPAQQLTPREIEVLGMLAEGLGNKTIARRLGISEHTVKFHVGSILAKLDASSRTEAVMLGARRGLIML